MESIEPQIERLLSRFRIPPEDAQEILDEIMLSMITKRDRIRDAERWLVRTLKNRCLLYWRGRRRALHRVLDTGIVTLLTSPEVPEEEKEALRRELAELTRGLGEACRQLLRRRYGLGEEAHIDPRSWGPEEEGIEETLRCIGALMRRLDRRLPPPGEPPRLEVIAGGLLDQS